MNNSSINLSRTPAQDAWDYKMHIMKKGNPRYPRAFQGKQECARRVKQAQKAAAKLA